MTFEKAFKFSSYFILLSGFLTLFVTGGVGVVLALIYVAAIALSCRIDASRPRPPASASDRKSSRVLEALTSSTESGSKLALAGWQQLLLVVAVLIYFVIDFSTVSGFVSATVHLLIALSLIKLFSRKNEKDHLLLYFISFAFVLIASTFTISIVFFLSLIVYVFFSILTFILFESKKAYEENRSAHFSFRGYAGIALLILALVTLVSAPIFVTIPRGSLGLFGANRNPNGPLSGFSDKVNLGEMGEIIRNTGIVMRARISARPESIPADTKWRGVALDYYDGKSWSNTGKEFNRVNRTGRGFVVSQRTRDPKVEQMVLQTIYLEPFTNFLFGAPQVLQISGNVSSTGFIFRDENGSLSTFRRGPELLRYEVWSDLISRNEMIARAQGGGDFPEPVQGRYLQLPAVHPAVGGLAKQIVRDQESAIGKALLIEAFLKNNYGYSLENQSANTEDPLYDFLFVSKVGHCEYFATAQAVMMRGLGIPARIVNGFQLGELNEWSDYYIVRQSDAHSWVEGYFAGVGWVDFDATPASETELPFYMARFLGNLLDAVDVFWTEIVTFDRLKQVGLFRSLAINLQSTWLRVSNLSQDVGKLGWLRGWIDFKNWELTRSIFLYLIPVLAAPLVGWVVYRYRRYFRVLWKQRVLKRNAGDIAPEYYLEMLDLLKRRGFVKKPCETPAEFVHRIATDVPSALPSRITELYYRNRFGDTPLEAEDLTEIYTSLKQLRHWRLSLQH